MVMMLIMMITMTRVIIMEMDEDDERA